MNKSILLCFMSIFITTLLAMERLRIDIPGKQAPLRVSCMQEIIKDVEPRLNACPPGRTVAIIDLDFTVFMANVPQGHPRFFKALVKFLQEKRNLNKDDAHNLVLMEIFSAAQALTTIQRDGHDEGPDARRLIQLFRERNIPVFAVTARSAILHSQTMAALNNLGFTFSMPNRYAQCIEFSQDTYPDLVDKTYFAQGVLFCGKNPKGPLISHFFRHYGVAPTTVFAFDDDEDNLRNIDKALQPFVQTRTYRYGFLDPETQDFELTDSIIPKWAREIPANVLSFEQFPEIGSPTSPGPSSYPALRNHQHIPHPATHE